MNLVALIGNVATEPDLRHTTGGKAVCSFRLALQRPGGDQADFVTVIAWERQAEVCKQYVTLGRRVAVEGRLHHSTWEVEEKRRSKVEIVATRVELLGQRRVADSEPESGADPDEQSPDHDHGSDGEAQVHESEFAGAVS